jgi:hypothetical protein
LFTGGIGCLEVWIPDDEFPVWAAFDEHHVGVFPGPASPYRCYRTRVKLLQKINRVGFTERDR